MRLLTHCWPRMFSHITSGTSGSQNEDAEPQWGACGENPNERGALTMFWGRIWWYLFVLAFGDTAVAETFLPHRSLPSSTSRRWINNSILLLLSNAAIVFAYRL